MRPLGGGSEVVKLLVGNKVDCDAVVPRAEAADWARRAGMMFIESSAKASVGVSQAFDEIIDKILENPVLLASTTPGKKKIDLRSAPHEGDGAGFYMYVESSWPNYPRVGPFALTSPSFEVAGGGAVAVRFWYHMNGYSMGNLSVEAFDGAAWTRAWTKVGDQGDSWQFAEVVPAASAVGRVRFGVRLFRAAPRGLE